jgi:hypothetical protein
MSTSHNDFINCKSQIPLETSWLGENDVTDFGLMTELECWLLQKESYTEMGWKVAWQE